MRYPKCAFLILLVASVFGLPVADAQTGGWIDVTKDVFPPAIPNDAVCDVHAFRKALKLAASEGGGVIYVPPGVYLFSNDCTGVGCCNGLADPLDPKGLAIVAIAYDSSDGTIPRSIEIRGASPALSSTQLTGTAWSPNEYAGSVIYTTSPTLDVFRLIASPPNPYDISFVNLAILRDASIQLDTSRRSGPCAIAFDTVGGAQWISECEIQNCLLADHGSGIFAEHESVDSYALPHGLRLTRTRMYRNERYGCLLEAWGNVLISDTVFRGNGTALRLESHERRISNGSVRSSGFSANIANCQFFHSHGNNIEIVGGRHAEQPNADSKRYSYFIVAD